MADRRRVAVNLELEIARYVGPAGEAAAVTRRVSSAIDDLGDEADGAGRDMQQLAANTDVAKHQVDNLGDKAMVTTGQLMLLEHQLHSTGRAARGLDMTPDNGMGGVLAGAGSAGAEFGSGAARSFSRTGMMAMRGPLIGVAVGAIAIFAPLIGAAVAGAVSGAIGGVGILGGVLSASKDPRVRAAAKMTGQAISEDFFGRGGAFVEPVIKSLDILKQGFLGLHIDRVLAQAAPFVEDLAHGIVGFVRGVTAGLNSVLAKSGEIIPTLAQGLEELGDGLGDMITAIANADGAVEGLKFLFFLTADVARGLGTVIAWLSARFLEMALFSARLSGALEDVLGWMPFVGDQIRNANDRVEQITGTGSQFVSVLRDATHAAKDTGDPLLSLAHTLEDIGPKVETAAEAWQRLNDELFTSKDAALALEDINLRQVGQWMELRKSVEENGHSLARNTEKGLHNREMIQGLLHGTLDIREANIRNGMSIHDANRAYAAQVTQLKKNLTQMGFNEAQIDDIIGKLADIPRDIHVTIRVRETRDGELFPTRGAAHRASGGPVSAGTLYEVNEGGRREFFRPSMSGSVVPLAAMSSASGGGGSMSVRPLVVNVGGPRSTQLAFDEFVQELGDRGATLAVIGIR